MIPTLPKHGEANWLRFFGPAESPLRRLAQAFAGKRPRKLRLREVLPLGERRFVCLVEWGGEELLIGSSSGQLTLLAQRAAPHETQEGCER